MARASIQSLNRKKLRRWLTLFFLALAIPTAALIYQAYDRLKWEAFHQHRELAEELANRIDTRYAQLIAQEERRSFTDYSFLVVVGDPQSNFVQRSPLSEFPVRSSLPGLIGYFQVDTNGTFTTPLLPDSNVQAIDYGIQAPELQRREALATRLLSILSDNRLVRLDRRDGEGEPGRQVGAAVATPDESGGALSSGSVTAGSAAEKSRGQAAGEVAEGPAAFDRLAETRSRQRSKLTAPSSLGRVEDLQLDSRYQQAPQQQTAQPAPALKLEKRATRKERSALPESIESAEAEAAAPPLAQAFGENQARNLRIRTFESEVDPFELNALDSGHLVLFRKVWRNGQRIIQGALIGRDAFLRGIVETTFRETALSRMSNLVVAQHGDIIAAYSAQAAYRYEPGSDELRGALLHQARLSAPLSSLELLFTVATLPAGPGGTVIAWIAGVLFLVLCVGFYGIYRLGIGQIELTTQQQDFVSAVSHELKTPLTSIRMYGEMLREGWAPEEKKREYYDFIHDESERLTRLINNVLQLARMTRNDLDVALKPVTVGELMDTVRSKIASQVERAGFTLNLECPDDCRSRMVAVDQDCFTQIIINLVDNAIKFSAKSPQRAIDLACKTQQDGSPAFRIRDYGPGIPKDQLKKIFRLFYRTESELTRETVGTGIGLALVNQLTAAMNGKVDVMNRHPGVEFLIIFPGVNGALR